MDPFGLIGGLASAGMGMLGASSSQKIQKQAMKDQRQQFNRSLGFAMGQHDFVMDQAHNQTQWRVEDAKRAGLSPIYALGAQPYSFAPNSVGGTITTPDTSGIAAAYAGAGNDISRALGALAPAQAKLGMLGNYLSLENQGLQNDLLRNQVRATSAPGTPPLRINDLNLPDKWRNANLDDQAAFGDLVSAFSGLVDFIKAYDDDTRRRNRDNFLGGTGPMEWARDFGQRAGAQARRELQSAIADTIDFFSTFGNMPGPDTSIRGGRPGR